MDRQTAEKNGFTHTGYYYGKHDGGWNMGKKRLMEIRKSPQFKKYKCAVVNIYYNGDMLGRTGTVGYSLYVEPAYYIDRIKNGTADNLEKQLHGYLLNSTK